MSDLETKAVEILDKLEAITENYAPDVAQAAVTAVKISAIGEIIGVFILLSVLIAGFYGTKRVCTYFDDLHKEDRNAMWSECGFVTYLISGIIGLVLAFGVIFTIGDIWVWTALFNPELALAHKITGL